MSRFLKMVWIINKRLWSNRGWFECYEVQQIIIHGDDADLIMTNLENNVNH